MYIGNKYIPPGHDGACTEMLIHFIFHIYRFLIQNFFSSVPRVKKKGETERKKKETRREHVLRNVLRAKIQKDH